MSEQLTQITKNYINQTHIKHRKKLGQYFTPGFVRQHLLNQLPKKKNARVLDPACGTGEFLLSANEYFKNVALTGWEIDFKLVKLSQKLTPFADIKSLDALKQDYDEKFDFVIGNPPYFEFKPDDKIKEKFTDVISGRANIFSMFIKLGLMLLKPNGYLAYVIPPSMNNGAYFSSLRNYIIQHSNIEYMNILHSPDIFDQAQQTVMIMILKKCSNKKKYVFTKNDLTIFTLNPYKIKQAFRGKMTLKQLGFTVKTGRIVWNQHRQNLTFDKRNSVPLIRAHNITDNGLVLDNNKTKPQYIKHDNFDIGPAIVVNRVSGSPANLSLKAAVIKHGMKFLGENHVNVIYPPDNLKKPTTKSITILNKIAKEISSPETINLMKLITGNTQISKTELENLMPISKF